MVDPARFFIPAADLKKFVDMMAYYKFNKLQIHLTDDQGGVFRCPATPNSKASPPNGKKACATEFPMKGCTPNRN